MFLMEKFSFDEKLLKIICFDADKKLLSFWVSLVNVYVENKSTGCIMVF